MASDANNEESSESSNTKDSSSGDASETSSSETSSSETSSSETSSSESSSSESSSSEVPKRKRTKSAELAAQIPKVGGDTSALFGSWDSVLGSKESKNTDSLFAPPPVLGGAKPKPTVPSFLPPSIAGDPSPSAPTVPSVTAPGAVAPSDSDAQDSNEAAGESEPKPESSELTEPAPKLGTEPAEPAEPSESNDEAADKPESSELTEPAPAKAGEDSEGSAPAEPSKSDDEQPESSEQTEPAPKPDGEDSEGEASSEASEPSASTEPRTSSINPAVKGEFGAADPTQRAEDDAKAEERWKAAFAQGEPEVGKPGSAFDDEASGSAAPPQPSEVSSSSEQGADSDAGGETSEPEQGETSEPEQGEADSQDAARPKPDKPAPPKSSALEDEDEGGSRGLLLVLAAAAALVLVFVFMSSSRNADKKPKQGSSDARPNSEDGPKQAPPDGPKARPPANAKTHDADKYASERKPSEGTGTETGAEGTGTETGGGETGTETGGEETGTETGGEETSTETGDEEPAVEAEAPAPAPVAAGASQRREVDDPRDPSLLPPGTSAEATKAFTRMPVSLSDGAPLGGVGRSGIHIDMLDLGGSSERENTGCDTPSASFSIESTNFVNVCIRAVHNRQEELLFIIWEKDGKVARRGKVKISEKSHAYPTRAYLQIRPEYVGSWRVRIVPEGETDTVLASAEFQISD